MSKRFVIGDVHGCALTLKALINKKIKPSKKDKIYFLGDYIDRGPDSKGVLKYILSLISKGYDISCLMGNHEVMLLNSMNSESNYYKWLWNGGSEALRSFKVRRAEQIPEKYINFLEGLKYYIELDNFILVHGGLNFNIENPLSDKEGMVWIRNKEVDLSKINNKKLIVGHTPTKLKKIKKSLKKERILLDGGCVYVHTKKKLGNLVALELNDMELIVQENIDM